MVEIVGFWSTIPVDQICRHYDTRLQTFTWYYSTIWVACDPVFIGVLPPPKNQLVWTFSNGSIRVESTHISGRWASFGSIQQNLVKPYIQLWIRNDVWHYILSWHNVVKTLIKHTIFDGWNPTHLLKWWIWERLIIVLTCFNHINAFEATFPLPFFSSPDLFCIEVSCLPKRLGLRGCP